MLEKNLTIIATLASVSTLVALLGTVLGMIRAFAAMGSTGAPDTGALATGISEAEDCIWVSVLLPSQPSCIAISLAVLMSLLIKLMKLG